MKNFFDGILIRLTKVFNPEQVGKDLASLFSNLIIGFLIFAAFYIIWKIIQVILKSVFKQTGFDKTTSSFIITTTKYILMVFGSLQALTAAGINTAALLTSMGIAGLTIGFAAKDALSNLISGLLIYWDRPFVIGDLVEVEQYYGRVDKITLRSTRIITVDGKMLAVPNTTIINSTVVSYTNFPNLRLDIAVTIDSNENIERTRKIMLSAVDKDDDYLKDPPPRVVVTQLNDYNIEVQLQTWLKNERIHIEKRFELRERIYILLKNAGITMPLETIQLAPFEAKIDKN